MKDGAVKIIAYVKEIEDNPPAILCIFGIPLRCPGNEYKVLDGAKDEIRRKDPQRSLEVEILEVQCAFSVQLPHERTGDQEAAEHKEHIDALRAIIQEVAQQAVASVHVGQEAK